MQIWRTNNFSDAVSVCVRDFLNWSWSSKDHLSPKKRFITNLNFNHFVFLILWCLNWRIKDFHLQVLKMFLILLLIAYLHELETRASQNSSPSISIHPSPSSSPVFQFWHASPSPPHPSPSPFQFWHASPIPFQFWRATFQILFVFLRMEKCQQVLTAKSWV